MEKKIMDKFNQLVNDFKVEFDNQDDNLHYCIAGKKAIDIAKDKNKSISNELASYINRYGIFGGFGIQDWKDVSNEMNICYPELNT